MFGLKEKIKRAYAKTSSKRFTEYLRNKGVVIGDNIHFQFPVDIDITRPSLITIGDNVRMNRGFTLLTHDFATSVFRLKYGDFVSSSGRVTIGNNVYFARNCTVFRGVTIGDNCIIGYGSTITRDIPANSVVVGTPAKVICTVDEYYEKRKRLHIQEAFEYARSIVSRFNRQPVITDFWEEFPLFIDGADIHKYESILPIKFQLGQGYELFKKNHKAEFSSFEDFLSAAGIK